MKLIEFLNRLFKDDGFLLIDANMNKHMMGIKKEKPITLKILDKSLHTKLLLLPDLYFGEGYTNGSIVIENGTLTEFLDIALKNVGRGETNSYNAIINKFRGTYRFLTNFNLKNKSKSNVAHHYDISEKLYDLFLDKNRQYSCAYFKNENESLEQAQQNKIDHIIKKLNLKPNQSFRYSSGWNISNRNSKKIPV